MTGPIERTVFDVAAALRVPVLVLALAALAVVLFELGSFAVELVRRRRRSFARLEAAVSQAHEALARSDASAAHHALRGVAWSSAMGAALALGLMGTLIPLSPALAGLASGNVRSLSDNLRVAFSVTVLGLLVCAIAFAISLVRDRLYSQDLSDLEYVAATITPSGLPTSRPLVKAMTSDDQPPTGTEGAP